MTALYDTRRADGARRRKPGSLVALRAGDLPADLPGVAPETEVICLNAVRQGKGFVNHYLVPLAPWPGAMDALPLLYVDYSLPLVDVSDAWTLDMVPASDGAPTVGRVLENPQGRFLKTVEPYKDAFSLAYVDIVDGQVRRRQDRGVTAVLEWRVVRRPGDTVPAEAAPSPRTVPAMSPAGVTLRRLEAADLDALAALCALCGLGEAGDLARRLRPVAESPSMIARLAESDGALVGVAWAVHDGLEAWGTRVLVAPAARRQGIGRRLVEALAAEARRLELRALHGVAGLAEGAFAAAGGFTASPATAVDRSLDGCGAAGRSPVV